MKYGLLAAESRIPFYNQPMDAMRAKELQPLVAADLSGILSTDTWSRIGICMGKQYLAAFIDGGLITRKDINIQYLGGGLGKRLSLLFRWLHEVPCGSEHRPDAVLGT